MTGFKVQLRGGFSDRAGIKSENTEMQIDTLDERTRIGLINATQRVYRCYDYAYQSNDSKLNVFIRNILADVYLKKIDYNDQYDMDKVMNIVCDTIRNDDFDDVLTIIEYLAKEFDKKLVDIATNEYNSVFEKEFVGYRIVDGIITPITNPTEIAEIQDATSTPDNEVNVHLEKSLRLLSDRQTPDYSNSIKESISAVERMCSIIIGKSTTLGEALNKLEKSGLNIHTAMKGAFEKLYGYTSDGSGIRHSGQLGGADSTFEEAKFMLVSCCAFVNYLRGVWAKHH